MKKRKIIMTLAVVFAITIPVTVFAATSTATAAASIRHFFGVGIDTSKLNEQQKSDVSTYTKKMADLEKEFINKMVSNGTITKEQGTAATKKIEDALARGTYSPNMSGKNGFGQGMRRGINGMSVIEQSTLTDKQKADFNEIYTKMDASKKELINKLVTAKLITKVQSDALIKRIEDNKTNNYYGMKFGKNFTSLRGLSIDINKLSAEQKTFFTDYSKRAVELQKELINKAVSNGAITKVQGDTMLERIQNMPTDSIMNGFEKGMRGKGFRNRGQGQNNNDLGTGTTKPM